MKKNYLFAFASLALALVGCVKNEIENPQPAGIKYLEVSTPATKTTLDEDGLTLLWKDGDKIKVNNHNSIGLQADKNKGKYAEFGFTAAEQPQAPYYAVYNATRAYGYGEQGGPHTYKLSLDYNNYTQKWYENSFDPEYSVLYGTSETDDLVFNHAMSYIKITPTLGEENVNIARIDVIAKNGEIVSGRMIIDTETGNLTPYRDNKSYVTMAGPADGVALGKSFMIAIPAQKYEGGLKIRIVDVDGNMMEKSTKAFTTERGKVYSNSVVYAHTAVAPALATAAEVSSSTACFTWTLGKDVEADITKAWTIQCSKNEDFTDATEYTIPEGKGADVWNNITPKFCFGGLEQDTKYYFSVKSGDGAWSEVVSATTTTYDKTVVTENAQEGDVILAEDFAASAVQAEIPAKAAGVDENGTGFTKYTGSFTVATGSATYIPEALKEWGFARGATGSANLYANQGHIKLGTGSAQSYLVTPELNAIPEGQMATLEVTLTLAVYPDAKNDLKNVTKFIVSSETGTMKSGTNFFTCKSAFSNKVEADLKSKEEDRAKWATYTVTLPNVRHGERLMIAAANDAGNNRLLVNDVKATIVSLGTQKVRAIKLVQADRTFATFSWENIASSMGSASTYCLNVYKDEACTQPVYNQDVITYDVPFSRYSPFGASKYIGQKSGSGISPTELQISCGLLKPDTDYWFRVKPIEESVTIDGTKTKTGSGSSTFSNTAAGAVWSDPFHFKTAPEHVAVENEVIYTGFDALSIGPNMETMNAGVAPQFDIENSDPQKSARIKFLTDFAGGTYTYGWCTWAPDRCNIKEGTDYCKFGSVVAWWGFCTENADVLYLDGTNKTFTLNGSTKRYNRLGNVGDVAGWYMTSQTFPGMGHALMNDVGNFVGTPALTQNLGASAATCTVRVKAAKIANDGNANNVTIKVYKYSKETNTLNTTEVATITIPGKSCYKSWTDATNYTTDFTTKDYTVEVDLAKGDALVFAVSKFAIFDEIQIVKK